MVGRLNDRNAHFFLDSGSCISLCSSQTLKAYGLTPSIESSNMMIVGVTGSMNVLGKAVLYLSWGNLSLAHTFIIVAASATPGTMLLGHDFLVKTDIMLHPSRNCIYLQDKQIDLLPYSRSWGSPANIPSHSPSHHPMPSFNTKPIINSFACNPVLAPKPKPLTQVTQPPNLPLAPHPPTAHPTPLPLPDPNQPSQPPLIAHDFIESIESSYHYGNHITLPHHSNDRKNSNAKHKKGKKKESKAICSTLDTNMTVDDDVLLYDALSEVFLDDMNDRAQDGPPTNRNKRITHANDMNVSISPHDGSQSANSQSTMTTHAPTNDLKSLPKDAHLLKRPHKSLKVDFLFQFPGNWSEFGFIENDFWSSTFWISQIQVPFTEFENPKNPGNKLYQKIVFSASTGNSTCSCIFALHDVLNNKYRDIQDIGNADEYFKKTLCPNKQMFFIWNWRQC